jgi:hypothetical protein
LGAFIGCCDSGRANPCHNDDGRKSSLQEKPVAIVRGHQIGFKCSIEIIDSLAWASESLKPQFDEDPHKGGHSDLGPFIGCWYRVNAAREYFQGFVNIFLPNDSVT